MADWTDAERDRREAVEAGGTVVANLKADRHLVAWAREAGVYVFIGRPGRWGNPFVVGRDGDRADCVGRYRAYLATATKLHARTADLRGKVLGCYCHPEQCHGHVLVEHLREHPPGAADEHDAR